MFTVEYKSGEEWLDTDFDEERYFYTIGYSLKKNRTASKSYHAEHLDLSKSGTYRFMVPFSVKEGDKYVSYKTWAEFKIIDDFSTIFLGHKNVSLLYYSPVYSYVMDPSAIPAIKIESNVIYTVSDGYQKQLGRVKEKALNSSDFDAFIIKYGGFDHSEHLELAKKLRENNKITYEIEPDFPISGIEIYYIMEQTTGETLIVYGHYENGEKENEIRFIYSVAVQ